MAVVTPDLPELFEEAFERAGVQMQTGYDLKTARRSLNILTLEWQNRGLNLWTIDNVLYLLRQAQQLILCLRTLLTSLNIKLERGRVRIRWIRIWSALAFQRMLNKRLRILRGAPLKFMLTVKQRLSASLSGLCRMLAHTLSRITAFVESLASRLE